jgi:hypothetical protein
MLTLTAFVLLSGALDLILQINVGRETARRRFSDRAELSDLRSTNLRAEHGKVP